MEEVNQMEIETYLEEENIEVKHVEVTGHSSGESEGSLPLELPPANLC